MNTVLDNRERVSLRVPFARATAFPVSVLCAIACSATERQPPRHSIPRRSVAKTRGGTLGLPVSVKRYWPRVWQPRFFLSTRLFCFDRDTRYLPATRLNTSLMGVSLPLGSIATTSMVMVLPSASIRLTPLVLIWPFTLAMTLTA